MEIKTYTEEQVQDIKEQAKKELYNNEMLKFAKQLESSISNNFVVAQKKNLFSKKFTADNVQTYLENPQKYEKELRQLSTVLTTLSPQYRQIVNYFPSIAKFVPVVIPNISKYTNAKGDVTDTDKIKKDYLKVVSTVEMMSLEHEFKKIVATSFIEDIFYGYVYQTNDSFYIQQLDADYCRISSISDGCYNFQFDFTYFDKNNKLKDVEIALVESYPEEFQSKYNAYLKDKSNMRWQEMDEKNTICIKYSDTPFVFPPFASLYNDLSDLQTYKNLSKQKEEIDNYKFIGLKIPLNTKSEKEDDFLVSTTTALTFYNMLLGSLPEGVGAFLSVTDWDSVDFSSSKTSEKNKILDAENSLMLSSGVSPVNFGKANNSTGLTASNLVDSGALFRIYDSLERWLNRKMKFDFNGKFCVELLKVTIFTLKDTIDQYIKTAQYGIPVKLQLSALLNATQGKERGLTLMEEILDLQNTWKPLMSSHTTSGNDEGGRPQLEDNEISESGEATRDNGSNEADAR